VNYSHVRHVRPALKGIARRANLLDPESAKTYLALAGLSENRRASWQTTWHGSTGTREYTSRSHTTSAWTRSPSFQWRRKLTNS
jgi:hypothetical protein